jgi:hypothetical protein
MSRHTNPGDSGLQFGARMTGQSREERGQKPQTLGGQPASWEATIWGRHIRCHELDQHLYLDGRFLDLTPIEFSLFWLLLRQALQAHTDVIPPYKDLPWDTRSSAIPPDHYLQRIGIVPTGALIQAVSSDLRSVISNWSGATTATPGTTASWPDTRMARGARHFSEEAFSPRSRAGLTSHLDRLRSKLRCHGLNIGTVLLDGRSAQGYLLCPLGAGRVEGGGAG